MKEIVKKIIPTAFLEAYHLFLAWLASVLYSHPSEKLVVIGVTGTNGKSTVVDLLGRILEKNGQRVGWTSTVSFKIGEKEWLNDKKMTMPGRFFLQRMLAAMVKARCKYAIIESSSEGVLQFRHRHINYDVMIFTNLTPEHLDRHGGFENYKQAKLEYFRNFSRLPRKTLNGKFIPKIAVVNGDDKFADDFLNYRFDDSLVYGIGLSGQAGGERGARVLRASEVETTGQGSSFKLGQQNFRLPLPGLFNVYNALAAIAAAQGLEIGYAQCRNALQEIKNVAGRMETIEQGQDFKVIIDYAPEPFALRAAYNALDSYSRNRLIHVLGSTGGGRDRARRGVLGELAGSKADIVIVTNEDPYDDDPERIISEVARGALLAGKRDGANLFRITNRRAAIAKALTIAGKDDLVLVTGKGSEQAMVVGGGKKIPWDDRRVAREELKKLLSKAAAS